MAEAIDISNYTGELRQTHLDWLRENADFVIVRLSTEDNRNQRVIAASQVRALHRARIPWQGYLWCYWDDDPFDHWHRATELLPGEWPSYHQLGIWLDMEDACVPARKSLEWVSAYANLLATDGFVPGVYTGKWWVDQHRAAFTGHRAKYWATFPVWWARYGIEPSCDLTGIEPFTRLAMHQFEAVDRGPVLRSYDRSHVCSVV